MLEVVLSTSSVVTRFWLGAACLPPRTRAVDVGCCSRCCCRTPLKRTISNGWGDESFADDLNKGRGTVSGRVALLLRSAEVHPSVSSICPLPPWDWEVISHCAAVFQPKALLAKACFGLSGFGQPQPCYLLAKLWTPSLPTRALLLASFGHAKLGS